MLNLFIVIILIAFILRVWPFFTSSHISSDIWVHKWRCKEIEQNNYKVPKDDIQFILPGRSCYPPLLHYLMLLFPEKYRGKYTYFISTFFDLLVILLYFFLWNERFLIHNFNEFVYGILIYFLSPIGLQFNGTPIYCLKARTIGRFSLYASFLAFYFFISKGLLLYLFVSMFFFAIIIVSSKFALQGFIFISLFICFKYPLVLLIIPGGFIMSLIFTFGFSYYILKEHVVHQYTYFKKAKYYGTSSAINNIDDIKFLINLKNIIKFPYKYFNNFVYNFSYTRLITLLPILILTIILISTRQIYLNFNLIDTYLLLWILGCLFAFIFTSTKTFISLGQPIRYLEYMILPMSIILLKSGIFEYLTIVGVCIVYGIFYIFTNFTYLIRIFFGKKQKNASEIDLENLRKFMNEKDASRIISVPMKFSINLADIHKHKYLWRFGYFPIPFYDEAFKPGRAPYPKSIPFLKSKYNLDTLIIQKSNEKEYEKDLKILKAELLENFGNINVYAI